MARHLRFLSDLRAVLSFSLRTVRRCTVRARPIQNPLRLRYARLNSRRLAPRPYRARLGFAVMAGLVPLTGAEFSFRISIALLNLAFRMGKSEPESYCRRLTSTPGWALACLRTVTERLLPIVVAWS